MDEYTNKTRKWLEKRFAKTDADGIYLAHQNIYGFRAGHAERNELVKYIRSLSIMRELAHIEFGTLLDVGGAEGYNSFLARRFFGVKTINSDLSAEACRRAMGIFAIPSVSVDAHELPFSDNSFDAVMCSESLEHVTDWKRALAEIIRVCSKAAVITLPHDPIEEVEKNVEKGVEHGHIHHFDTESLDYLETGGLKVLRKKIIGPLLGFYELILHPTPQEHRPGSRFPRIFKRLYNASIPVLEKGFNDGTAAFLVDLDTRISKRMNEYGGILFTVIKDVDCYGGQEQKKVSARKLIKTTVPYYYLGSGPRGG